MAETDARPHITVFGDLILDRYLIGDATKLNPEMPGVVIHVEREDDRLGGAAAVAMLAAGLGARVTLAGIIGRDEPGQKLLKLLESHDIEPHLWFDDRPTTWKQRIVARGQLRPDRCDREVTAPIDKVAERFLATVPIGEVLLVSDYGKGTCTQNVMAGVCDRARAAHVPIVVDPARSRSWSEYGLVTVMKANWLEAMEQGAVAGATPIELAQRLSDLHNCHVIITLGERGLICAEYDGDSWHLPARQVTAMDVCGAGDTVLATIGASLARGDTLREACQRSVLVAAQQVSRIGITSVLSVA